MGTVQFQELSLAPPPPPPSTAAANSSSVSSSSSPVASSSSSPIAPGFKIPKIEPKLEPLDEPLESPTQSWQPQDPHDDTFFSDSPRQFPNSTPDGFSNSQTAPSAADDNVYSQYCRLSELFRQAFAERIHQQYNDVAVLEDSETRAIVPVNTIDDNCLPTDIVVRQQRRSYQPRSSELVRVNDLSIEDKLYFRDLVRRTRRLYDSLRIFSVLEQERRQGEAVGRRARGDLRASQKMRERGLWLHRDKRIVGNIPGIDIGDIFFFRMELCVLGLHGQAQAGIDYVPASQSSNGEPIATSIIVSGGYEDDEDAGDVIIYTGHGGQDKFSRQCMDQKPKGGNLAMERSMQYGIEVRVIRGFKYEGSVSSKVYVYDGLYTITNCWFDVGRSGFRVWKYKLLRREGQPEMGSAILKLAENLRAQPLAVRPRGYLSLDISNRKESVPVLVFNDIDNAHDPLRFKYMTKAVFPPLAFANGSGSGCDCDCDCESGCVDGCLCALRNGGQFPYDNNGFLIRGKPVIFECGPSCKCPPSCRNRVTQKGLRNRLEVFRSRQTDWGVRSLDLIHAGSFICEYAGVVLTREQAEVFTMNGDSLIYPYRFSNKWAEWGDLSDIYPDYQCPSNPSIPPLDFALEVSSMRNVACYFSQSPTPNLLAQFVLYDHNNLMFPHVMLFAMENIPPLRELSLDYGVDKPADESRGKLAICN